MQKNFFSQLIFMKSLILFEDESVDYFPFYIREYSSSLLLLAVLANNEGNERNYTSHEDRRVYSY